MDKIVLEQGQAYEMLLKDYPDVMLIGDLCSVLDISIKTAYRLIKEKQIEARKDCGKWKKKTKVYTYSHESERQ